MWPLNCPLITSEDSYSMQQAEIHPEAAAVAAIAPHHPPLPMLIRDRPLDWFALIEFQLTIRKITKPVDKFSAIVNSLPTDVQANLADIFRKVSELPDPFQTVKDRLCHSFVRSEFDLCNEIIHHPPLGSDKPSALLDKMILFLPEDEPQGHLFKTHFLNRLPATIRQHLLHQKFATIRDMANFADTIFDMDKANHISAAKTFQPRSPSPHRRANRSPSPHRRRAQTPHKPPPVDNATIEASGLCFYHYSYGSKAQKCRQPCNYRPKN